MCTKTQLTFINYFFDTKKHFYKNNTEILKQAQFMNLYGHKEARAT